MLALNALFSGEGPKFPILVRGELTCILAKPPALYLSLNAEGQPAVTAVYTTLSVCAPVCGVCACVNQPTKEGGDD